MTSLLPVLMEWDGGWFGLVMLALVLGAIGGFFLSRYIIKRELKKNPPINEKMIRAMFLSMGRKPSEAQIRAVMRNMQNSSNL